MDMHMEETIPCSTSIRMGTTTESARWTKTARSSIASVVQSNDKNNTEPFEQYAQSQGWYTQGSTLYDSTETKSALPLGSMVPRKELMQRLPNS